MANKILLTAAVLMLAACANDGAGDAKTPDGEKIDLSGSPRGLVSANTINGKLTGYNQNHSFYGIWEDKTSNLYEWRYQGKEATDIPKSGHATYHGHAIRVDAYSGGLLTNGTSYLNVDFGNKIVNGKITMPGAARNITLHNGYLSGSKYAGHASALGNQHGYYKGALMGPSAKETAGRVEFENESGLNTVFGGVRY